MRFRRATCAAAGLVGLASIISVAAPAAGATTLSPSPAVSAPAPNDPQTLGVAGDPTAEGVFWVYANSVRASLGVPALRYDPRLQAYAQQRAEAMAATQQLVHSDLGVLMGTWSAAAENIGCGPSADAINQSLTASPSHYQNLTAAAYNAIGVGVAYDGAGRMWTAEIFAS